MNVLVYSGEGVSKEALHHALYSLKRALGQRYDIKTVSKESLKGEPWEEGCSLLVFTGGRDLPFVRDLQQPTLQRVRKYVFQKQGRFMGLCAGAYFACKQVEFEQGSKLEVIGPRDLQLCSALARGSVFPGFEYDKDTGARAASLRLLEPISGRDRIKVYVNGGCSFGNLCHDHLQYRTIAAYGDDVDCRAIGEPAIVMGYLPGSEKASVVLSGGHFEYHADELKKRSPDLACLPELLVDAEGQDLLWRHVLVSMGLDISHVESDTLQTPLICFGPKQWCSNHTEINGEQRIFSFTSTDVTGKTHPILLQGSTPLFKPELYYETLGASPIGQDLLYAERLDSTQTLLSE